MRGWRGRPRPAPVWRIVLRDEAGFSNMVFALFLMLAMVLTFNAVTLYSQVQTERSQVAQALTLALQSATTGGASITPDGHTLVWQQQAAFARAILALTVTLPIAANSSGQGNNGYYADFTPLPKYAPQDWTGTIQLQDFQTSSQAGDVTFFGQTQHEPEPYVAAELTVPITEHFMGIPLQFTVQVARAAYVNGYNGSQFAIPH